MKLHRIYAIILRYLFLLRKSYDRLTDMFYWPTIDLLVWGLTSEFLRSFAPDTSYIILIIVSGILLWLVTWRAQYEISVGLLEDLWNQNLINIFVSPLTFREWISAFLIVGIIKAVISIIFASVVAYILYHVHILNYGIYLVPFFSSLMLTGWAIGFFVAGLILRFGTRIQTLAWSFVAVFSPFAAIYYPVSVLPEWAQKISLLIPPSYIFEGSREVIKGGSINIDKLLISFGLNFIYLILTFWFLRRSFAKVLEKGLTRIE